MMIKRFYLFFLNRFIRRFPPLTAFLFGVKVRESNEIHWDFTTIVLKWALLLHTQKHERLLEIGTGPFAILSVLLAKRGYSSVGACDINETYVEVAKRNCLFNNVTLRLTKSDLFRDIRESYDTIFFNAVYIPEVVGNALKLNLFHTHQCHWCGGQRGNETIERFLIQASAYLAPGGKLLLGFNPRYLQIADFLHLNRIRHNFKMVAKIKRPFLPNRVLILERKSS